MLAERQDLRRKLDLEMDIDQDFIDATSLWQDRRLDAYFTHFPKQYKLKIPPIAKDAIDIGRNQIMTGDVPDVKVILPENLHRDPLQRKEHEQRLERGLRGFLYEVITNSKYPFLLTTINDGMGLGMGAFAYPIDYDRWPEHPLKYKNGKERQPRNEAEKKVLAEYTRARRNHPFNVRAVHPRNFYPDPFHDPAEDVIEVQTLNIGMVRRRRELLDKRIQARWTHGMASSQCVYYVSPDWWGLWLNQEPILDGSDGADADGIAPNRTGIIWYEYGYAPFGSHTAQEEPEHQVKGILRDARDAIVMYITALNVLEAIRQTRAFPPIWGAHSEGKQAAAEEMADLEMGPAKKFASSTQLQLSNVPSPEVPQVVFNQLEEAKNLLEVHFGPEILRGIYRDDTASGQAQRYAVATLPYRPWQNRCQQMVATFLRNVCRLVKEELQGPLHSYVKVRGGYAAGVLAPEDIPEDMDFEIRVDFSPATEEERAFELQSRTQKLQAGGMSLRRYIEADEDVEDPEEEMAQILADKIMQQPEVITQLAQIAVTEAPPRTEQATPPAALTAGPPAPPPAGSPQDIQQRQNGYFEGAPAPQLA